MDSVMTPMAQQGFYFYSPDTNPDARQHGHFVQHIPVYNAYTSVPQLSSTPYSRPTSSCSQPQLPQHQQQQHIPLLMPQPQPIKPYSAIPASFITPMPSPPAPASAVVGSNGPLPPQQHYFHYSKPTIMLESEYCPATPPLSSASSSISSPGSYDVLATPHNPMLTGFDKASIANADKFALAWSSPPLTPAFVQGQLQYPTAALAPTSKPAGLSNDLLSVSACPSLSPSPSPHTRSIAPEVDNDFCDPRDLTVSSSSSDSGVQSPEAISPVLSAPCPVGDASNDDIKTETPVSPAAAHADDFVLSHALCNSDEFPDVESDDIFVNELVNLGGADFPSISRIATPELTGRSRATSAASSNSDYEFFDSWESFGSCDNSDDSEAEHPSKRQRTESCAVPIVMSAVSETTNSGQDSSSDGHSEQADASTGEQSGSDTTEGADNGGQTEYGDNGMSAPMPTSRRGRKQSLTEDPSKTFACDLCNRRFRRQEHLKRHYRSLHTQDKPFTCHECGKKFSRSDNLAQHARTHGAGAFVMNLYDDPDIVAAATGGYAPHGMYGHSIPMGDDFSGMGRVLFQVAAEIPGSSSEPSSDEGSDKQSKKKRKRSD